MEEREGNSDVDEVFEAPARTKPILVINNMTRSALTMQQFLGVCDHDSSL